jgi:RhoGEF domain
MQSFIKYSRILYSVQVYIFVSFVFEDLDIEHTHSSYTLQPPSPKRQTPNQGNRQKLFKVETETVEDSAMAQFYVPTKDTSMTESGTDTEPEGVAQESVEAVQDKLDIMNLSETPSGPSARDQALKNREYVLKELISTEKIYIDDLAQIVDGYIAEIRDPGSSIAMPEDLAGGKERMVFGNIGAIYEWHRE